MNFKLKTLIVSSLNFSLGKFFVMPVLIFGFFIMPTVTHAGILSFFTDIFSSQDVSAQTETVIKSNSQNILLPEPAINFDLSLKTGSEVMIDGGEALLSEVGPLNIAPEEFGNSNGQISIYIVRSGDTLAKVAKMFDVSVNTILWANDLTRSSALKIGQELVILPMSGVMHTVVSGDTLSSITKKYGGDLTEIAMFNDLKSTAKLAIGDIIIIPDGQVSSSIRPSVVSSSASKLITSTGGPSFDGYYTKPFVGGHKTQGLHGYNGVDYGMPIGTSIYASAAGTIIISKSAGYNGGYGNYIVIQHANNTQTVYGHLNYPVVLAGQIVGQGQLIGYSGNTGKSTGPHLHFEIRGAKNPF